MNSSTSWIFSLSKMIQYFIHYIIWNKHKWNWGRTRNQICFYSKICDWSWSCLFKLFVFQAYGSNLWKNSTFFLTTWFLFKCQHPLPTNPTTRTINDYGLLHSAAEENVLSQLGTHLLGYGRLCQDCPSNAIMRIHWAKDLIMFIENLSQPWSSRYSCRPLTFSVLKKNCVSKTVKYYQNEEENLTQLILQFSVLFQICFLTITRVNRW